MASVSVQNLSIAIGKNTILQNININFREGKRTAIIGPNGCGKSSFAGGGRVKPQLQRQSAVKRRRYEKHAARKIAELLAILPQA